MIKTAAVKLIQEKIMSENNNKNDGKDCKPCNACVEFYNSGSTGGYNCSETTLYGLSKYLEIDSEMLPKLATPFGGGIGRNGHICGSLVGALIAIGLKWGRDSMDEERAPAYERADRLVNKFLEKFGTLNCAEITGLDMKNAPPEEDEKLRVHHNICKPLVRQVCKWAIEELEREEE